jgi:hypothetical protein
VAARPTALPSFRRYLHRHWGFRLGSAVARLVVFANHDLYGTAGLEPQNPAGPISPGGVLLFFPFRLAGRRVVSDFAFLGARLQAARLGAIRATLDFQERYPHRAGGLVGSAAKRRPRSTIGCRLRRRMRITS